MFRRLQGFWAQGNAQKVAVVVVGIVVLCSCCGVSVALVGALTPSGTTAGRTPTNTVAVRQATATTVRSTPTAQVSHYPPKTHDDLTWLAARGNASAINVTSTESTGLVGVCPEPRSEVWVSPSVKGQQLAQDLLAYFYNNQFDSACGSLILVYNSQSEAKAGDAYTAGRINLDVTDSSGQANVDPNGTNLTYTVTLDIGDAITGQEYTITYTA
ncbi:MAG TPA: hypothetical protein VF725_08025 [Ktedonobacterales bacterium]